jgi:hypothetical protein
MVKPYQMLQAEIDKQDAAVAQLLSQVGDWEKLRDDPNSQKAYNSYKEYETKLRDLANDIADNGLRNNAKSRVLNLAAQYSGTINPIKEAWDRRNKLAEMTFKMGPSAILQFNPAERGLDEFMKNPMLTPKVLDRNAIAKQASDMYSTFTNDLLAVKQGPNIDKYHNTFYKKYGITSDQASDFVNLMKAGKVNEAMQKYPSMQSIFNQVYDDTGVASWGNPEADAAVRNSILNGAYSAIGKSDVQMYEDKEAVGALELRNRIRAERAARAMTATPTEPYRSHLYVDSNQLTIGADSSKAESTRDNAFRKLGIHKDKTATNKILFDKIKVDKTEISRHRDRVYPTPVHAENKDGSKDFRVFDKNGRMLSEREFIAQGKSDTDKKVLKDHWNKTIIPALKSIGTGYGPGGNTIQNVWNRGTQHYENSGATYISSIPITLSDNNKAFKEKLSTIIDNAGGVYRMNSMGDYRKSKRVSAKDIASKLDDDNVVSYDIINEPNHKGLVISVGNERWFLPQENMRRNAQNAFNQSLTNAADYMAYRQNFINKNGLDAWEADPFAPTADATINAFASTGYRNIISSLFGEYEDPKFKVVGASETK